MCLFLPATTAILGLIKGSQLDHLPSSPIGHVKNFNRSTTQQDIHLTKTSATCHTVRQTCCKATPVLCSQSCTPMLQRLVQQTTPPPCTHCQQLQTYTLVPLTRDTQNQELQGAKAHSYLADVPSEHSLLQPLLCRRVQLQDEKTGATME